MEAPARHADKYIHKHDGTDAIGLADFAHPDQRASMAQLH
jgi:hypothetical protein